MSSGSSLGGINWQLLIIDASCLKIRNRLGGPLFHLDELRIMHSISSSETVASANAASSSSTDVIPQIGRRSAVNAIANDLLIPEYRPALEITDPPIGAHFVAI